MFLGEGIEHTVLYPAAGYYQTCFYNRYIYHCAEAQLEYQKFVRSAHSKTHASERDPLSAFRFNPYCLTRIPA